MIPVSVGPITIGHGMPLTLIAGPCVIEPGRMTQRIAERLETICDRIGMPLIFKASYYKANRSSINSYRGPGLDKGLKILEKIRQNSALPITTDIHEPGQAAPVAGVVDLLQIPAMLCRQTDLLLAAARTGKPVNVKKGQFMAPHEMGYVITKLVQAPGVLLTERGTTFGYGLVNDMRAITIMQASGVPVVFDATHSAGGNIMGRTMVPTLARAAVAAGCDALFLEVHPDPDNALSDGKCMLYLGDLEELLLVCQRIRQAL